MDRRRFLLGAAWTGLAVGLGTVASACSPDPLPPLLGRGTTAPSAGQSDGPDDGPSLVPTSPSPQRDNPVSAENLRPGTGAWDVRATIPQGARGFVDRPSIGPGEILGVHVASATTYDIDWYRLGWYDGDGGRLLRTDSGLPGGPSAPAALTAPIGLAEAPWPRALSLEIPRDWQSGMYLGVIRPAIGGIGLLPFVVRPPVTARAPVLFVSAAATWQAYNLWGGHNLYDSATADSLIVSTGRRATQVSFDRPYAADGGAGFQRRWELQFVRWQEREGRDVEYATDIDLELHPDVVLGRRLLVFAGHHEYWSRPMRTTLERAIAAGVNVAFISANELYWQVRLEDSPLGSARRMTCYKSAQADPLTRTSPALTTCRWREAPVSEPEAEIVGQMYGHVVRRPADWVVRQSDHWLYEGTGLGDGDHIVNLVGQEFDTYFADLAPPGTVVLARGPVEAIMRQPSGLGDSFSPPVHTATMYTADSGATVFAAGTFQWAWAIDDYGDRRYRGTATPYDPRVAAMTSNLFDRLGDGPA